MTKQIEQQDAQANDNSAIDLLRSLQGDKTIIVPLVINGQKVHSGITFKVGTFEYNNFLNASQSPKTTMTAAASTFLKQTVVEDDLDVLNEALKVAGMLDFFMGEVVSKVAPEIGATLD